MRILLLNSPPRAGKDTAAQMIKAASSTDVHLEKFAMPMKIAVPLIYGLGREEWEHLDSPANKDYRCDQFFGKTPREVKISFSEYWLKPMHGKTIFGELLARRIKNIETRQINTVVVSDSGFREEAEVLVNKFGPDNIWLVRISRQGCDFKKDTRGYIDLQDLGVYQTDIANDSGLDDFRKIVLGLYKAFSLPREQDEDLVSWKSRQESIADAIAVASYNKDEA